MQHRQELPTLRSAEELRSQSGDYGYDDSALFAVELERYWAEALSIKYWLLGLLLTGLVLSVIVTLLTTPLFQAEARVEISQSVNNVTDLDPLTAESRVSDLQYLTTQYELLESRFMAKRVIEAGNLSRDAEFLESLGLADATEIVSDQRLGKALLDNIEILPVNKSNLVDIGYSNPSASVAQRLSNLWAEEFIAANYEKLFGDNIEAREFLQDQISELRDKLALSEQEL